ncbi:nucleoside triphosphate pyrophosphohydrolase [Reinekea thalattae]|uniref:Nucleoside triphosphate pyrophosphohydrolase n=1 Tax=Reinekea thalattae TaxID=2593301 RepID=A0A5C8Z719_9GAMM|nr:nucleoside triphosphate pyrophosphohydrolase [Reinekea thalattae]TXR53084.1 nucleoside triphosphate pyrophosphohydrolase [Reinekea thalattae]
MSRRYNYQDLKTLMARLRDKDSGCPWDVEQSYRTIVPHTLEEVYEVIDAIERQDYDHLAEELGDLLFQVVFYAQIAAEEERFALDDVIHQLVEKMLYRHPHVFINGDLDGKRSGDVNTDIGRQWEALKQQQKPEHSRILDDVPKAMPGLLRAKKLQKKAAKVGFDWPNVAQVIDKAHEELAELEEAIELGDNAHIESEIGDLLFVMANVCRHLNIDPEQAIRNTNQKFERRFGYVEQQVAASGNDWSAFQLQQLDEFWDQAKAAERNKSR